MSKFSLFTGMFKKHEPKSFPKNPSDGYTNPDRKFAAWADVGKNQWYQGELTYSTSQQDGKGVLVQPGSYLAVGHWKESKYHGEVIIYSNEGSI